MKQAERSLEELLVLRAQAGDSRALDQLVRLRGPRLLVHAMRLSGRAEDARDIVQEAWIEILRGLHGLREARAFAAWATRIVTRRAARFVRGNVARRALSAAVSVETETSMPDVGEAASDARAVRKAMSSLPPDQAATIALFYLEDMSVAEVAIALDIPRGTVKTRLMHARAKLKDALKGACDEQT